MSKKKKNEVGFVKRAVISVKEFMDLMKHKEEGNELDLDVIEENLQKIEPECNKAHLLGQKLLLSRLAFVKKVLEKEKKILENGLSPKYVWLNDVKRYIALVENQNTKIIQLEHFERLIPDEVATELIRVKEMGIFDNFAILYNEPEDPDGINDKPAVKEEIEKERNRLKDPILFGYFKNRFKINEGNNGTTMPFDNDFIHISDKLYYIADWEDDYCDLSLEAVLDVLAKNKKKDVNIDDVEIEDILYENEDDSEEGEK